MNTRIRYTEEFKREAVSQVIERGHSVTSVASRLGVSTKSLYDWKKRYAGDGGNARQAKDADDKLRDLLLGLPNLPYADVPDGKEEDDNVEINRWGTPRDFDFTPLEHYEIPGAKPGFDFETAAKVSGARFMFLSGAVAAVHRALGQFMLTVHITENGLTETWTPVLVRPEAVPSRAHVLDVGRLEPGLDARDGEPESGGARRDETGVGHGRRGVRRRCRRCRLLRHSPAGVCRLAVPNALLRSLLRRDPPLLGDPDRCCAVVPRPWHPTPHPRPRHDGGIRRRVPARLLVGKHPARLRDPVRRPRLQPARRRAPRRAGSPQ